MPCYHPLTAYGIPNPETGVQKIVFLKKEPTPEHVAAIGAEKLQLPCGQCIGCRLEYSRQWAIRCVLEAKQWQHNYFVTLTYDDDHLPMREHFKVDKETGEVIDQHFVATLVPDHMQAFLKRLRQNMRYDYHFNGIRFFGSGEYGDKNFRPHMHLILFNCPLPDLQFEFANDGFIFYKSPFIDRAWHDSGMTLVSDFSFDTARYVAKYMLKKHKGKDAHFYSDLGIEPEFCRCSRRPGIGRAYYEQHKDDMYKYDSLVVPGGYGKVITCSPPKYFDRLYDLENHDLLAEHKARRKESAELAMAQQLLNTTLAHDEYLEVCEGNRIFNETRFVRGL